MGRYTLAFLGIAGGMAVFPLHAQELNFDKGVKVTPVLNQARREAQRATPALPKTALAEEDTEGMVWVALENADAKAVRAKIDLSRREVIASPHDISLFPVKESELPRLSQIMHERRNRCGGFFAYDSREDAVSDSKIKPAQVSAHSYAVSQVPLVNSLLAQVSESEIRKTISTLAAYNNRYYKADTGVASSNWIRDTWTGIAKGRSDVSVELFSHDWPQPSVILTIQGSREPGKVVVLGGHADSIAGYWGGAAARAPGADDNASGIAVLTEALRVLVATGFKPERTVKFMAYAAEEVGLRGSRDIATDFKAKGVDVQGVIQFDMTSFNGSPKSIYLITDHTNAAQNAYLGKLIDEYVKVPWGTTACGYGCSDHASWTKNGFPASFPFEAAKDGMNHSIHSDRDTLGNVGGTADHAVPFANLAVAYAVETSKAATSTVAAPSTR